MNKERLDKRWRSSKLLLGTTPLPRRGGVSVQVYLGRCGSLQRRPRLAAEICGEQSVVTRWTSATE